MTDLDSQFVEALIARMRHALQYGADESLRSEVYRRVRVQLQRLRLPDGRPNYALRLAAEYAIRDIENEYSETPPAEASENELVVWSYIERTSPNCAFVPNGPLSPAAERLFRATEDQSQHLYGPLHRIRIISSLWLRAINHEAAADRIGYIWLILDPLIHVMIICFVSLFVHPHMIYSMPSFTFGVIGACFWLTFRTAAIGAMFGGGSLVAQLAHPPIRRMDVMTARSLNAIIVYTCVGACLIAFAMWMDLATWPRNALAFAFFYFVTWLIGLSYGTIANSLLLRYPGVRRMNAFVFRVIAIASGLFYVSEQMPDDISYFFLFNPLLHVVQLARSAWFAEYDTTDASLAYLFYFTVCIFLLALACWIVDDKWPGKVRS